jgi:hypothetical protein
MTARFTPKGLPHMPNRGRRTSACSCFLLPEPATRQMGCCHAASSPLRRRRSPPGEAAGVINSRIRMSAVPSMLLSMLNQHTTGPSLGHYRVRCSPGSCAAEAAPGTSNIEREIFTKLDSVFGGGKHDYVVPDRYGLRSDMAFPIDGQLTLVIEYDGAHWHIGHEPQDQRKAEIISRGPWKSGPREVVRIREHPLRPLRANDVWVPSRADASTCSRLVLQHIAHRFFGWTFGYEVRIRIDHFLAAAATPLTRDQVPCKQCWHITRTIRRAQAKLTPVLPPPWGTLGGLNRSGM